MLKYFNENISLALQERYRDLHEYRRPEIEDGAREPKLPKIAEDPAGAASGTDRPLDPPKEEDSFVASWLQSSFKMTPAPADGDQEQASAGSALDLRAAPLSLHIPMPDRYKQETWRNRSRPNTPPVTENPPPPTPHDHAAMAEKLVNEIQVSFF